jgi:sodium transport system ATP-binding protein
MICIEQLSKSFGGTKKIPRIDALKNISLRLHDGEITGLLGLNGAGKSTLMRLIYGLLEPSSGEIFIDNSSVTNNPYAARKKLGVLPDDTGLYKRLTARENIRYYGELQGLSGEVLEKNISQLIAWLGMEAIAERKAEGFSLGERMKTALARSIVHKPQHVLLDEPTNGLDVITTRAVRRLLHELKTEGRCVLFSSHLMHEVSGLCDRVVVIAGGKIVADGSVADIIIAGEANNLEDAFINLVQPSLTDAVRS